MSQPLDLLKTLKEHKGPNGVSLFDHLCTVFESMVHDEGEGNKYETFEMLSNFLKNNTFTYKPPKSDKEVNVEKDYSTQLTAWYNECLNLLDVRKL